MADDFVGVPYDRWLALHEKVSGAAWLALTAWVFVVLLTYMLFAKGVLTISDLRAAGG